MAEEKSIEEQLKEALDKVKELTDLTAKQKAAIDNASADASKHKKEASDWQEKYKATLSEQEKAQLEAKQREETMLTELNSLKAEKRVSTYKAKLMEAGYDAETADKMAVSLPEGVGDEFFDSQKTFLEAKTQEIKTKSLNGQPPLSNGNPPANDNPGTDEQMRKWFGLK